jgi:hypothetical protein
MERSDCMSNEVLTLPPLTMSMATSVASGSTMGRLVSVCGAIGTSTQPGIDGCRMGPPADSEYAVAPVGEATIRPSARWLATNTPSTSTRSSTMPEVELRLTTTSLSASASNTQLAPRMTRACISGRASSS